MTTEATETLNARNARIAALYALGHSGRTEAETAAMVAGLRGMASRYTREAAALLSAAADHGIALVAADGDRYTLTTQTGPGRSIVREFTGAAVSRLVATGAARFAEVAPGSGVYLLTATVAGRVSLLHCARW